MLTSTPAGYGTMTIGGAERPYHVGYNQGSIFCRLPERLDADGRPLSLKAYGEIFSLTSLKGLTLSLDDVRDFVYSALASGCLAAKTTPDFTSLDVGYWLDEADEIEVGKVFREMGEQTVRRFQQQIERTKNAQAPALATEPGPALN